MSGGNTETRILQMQLENKDFEEGVRQTIKSLENLEAKLELKNAGDGFEKVSAAANSVQMSHLESGLDTVTSKFTLMGQIGLQVLERISGKIVNIGESILKAATVAPLMDGWSEFEMKTNSIQTILGGIRNSFEDQPTAINAISAALDELNEYADKTIYNFAQMTENVGKFTNQGLSLETSTNAIKGIANWAAAVGADPTQMSRAMYNISQSLGAGSMQLIDWRSIRFANMATPEVKKLFVEVAKNMDDMLDDEGNIKIGKQTLNALEDFEGTLKGGWLTNEVMAEAFAIYANAYSETELIEKYGEELGRTFYEMGVYAEEAATKVKTFSQLIGVLKESLGSGWAQSFDILFGGFEQQMAFLTAIKERIEEIINFQTEDRNTWLQNFSDVGGVQAFQDTILKTLDILSDFYWVLNDVAALILNPFGKSVFNMTDGIFGPRQEGYTDLQRTWEGMKGLFDDINNQLDRFRQWMYQGDEKTGRSPIHNLASALSGVAGVAGIAWQVLSGFGKMVFRLFKRFEPLVSSVLDLLGQIGGVIYNTFFVLTGEQTIEKIFDKIESAIGPVIDLVVGLASAVVDLIHNLLGVDKAADDWTVLQARMQAFWNIFKYDQDLSFADNMRNSLKNALIAVFGQDTVNSLIAAWDENIAPVLEQIAGFFTDAFNDMNRVLEGFRHAAAADYSQGGGFATFFQAFFEGYYGEDVEGAEQAFTNILSIYQGIQKAYDDNVAPIVGSLTSIFTETLPELNKTISDFIFGQETTVITGPGQAFSYRSGGIIDQIKGFFEDISWESIKGSADDAIGSLGEAWDKLNAFLFGPETTVITGPGQAYSYRSGGVIDQVKGVFEDIAGFFESDTWKSDWEIIQNTFTEVTNWISSVGNEAWNTIMTFLFGPETTVVTGPGQAFTQRSGGIYQEALVILNDVWEWIQDTGRRLYNYVTTHDFKQMWDDLNTLLFGYDTTVVTGPGQAFTTHTDGMLTPVVEMLRPISEAFEKVKAWGLEKLSSIDWAGIWESIGRFFGGYDEFITEDSRGYPHTGAIHHEGVFEKIAGFFERIINWYEEHKETFDKIFGWIGGLGDTIWSAFGDLFSGKGLGGFGNIATYLSGGLSSLINKIFPNGFDLSGIFGGLLGGTGSNGGQTSTSGGGFNLLNLILGTANADEVVSEAKDQSAAVVADLEEAGKATSGIGDALSNLFGNLEGLIWPIIGIVAAGTATKLLNAISGKEHVTLFDKIISLLQAIGTLFQGIGIFVGVAALVDTISPSTLDHVFDRIKNLLWTVTLIMGLFGGVSFGADILGEYLGDKWANQFSSEKNPIKPQQTESFASNVANFATAMKTMMEAVDVLIDDILRIGLWENFTDLKSGVGKVTELITEVFTGLIAPAIGGGLLATLSNAANTFMTSLADSKFYQNFTGDNADVERTQAATDTFSSVLVAIGSLFESVATGVTGIIEAAGILIPLIPDDKFDNIIELLKTISGMMTTIGVLVDAFALIKTADKAITIFGVNSDNAESIINVMNAGSKGGFMKAIKGIGIASIIVAALLLLSGLALFIIERNIDSYSKTVYRAIALVKNVLDMINSISDDELTTAQGTAETAIGVVDTVAKWSFSGGDPVKNAQVFRQMGTELAIGLNALGPAINSYPTGKALEVVRDLDGVWRYFHGAEGDNKFDVTDFQGKISFLERAGQGFASAAESFRGVTQDDVDDLSIVKTYASELSTIAAILSSVSMFNAFTGFNGKSFVETLLEMSRIGHVIKDESGEVQGLEELDGEKIRGYFNEILIALPDDPQLLKKLEGFSAAGGSNIGLFATSLLSLNQALSGYRDILTELDDPFFNSDTNVLGTIDQLGQNLTTDYPFLSDNSVQNMNTRLGIFAADLKTLADSIGTLSASTKDAQGNDYNFTPIADLLSRMNLLGTYVDPNGWISSTGDHFGTYVTNFSTIAGALEGLISNIAGLDFNTADLRPIGDFLVQVAQIEPILSGVTTVMNGTDKMEGRTFNNLSGFATKSALWLNDFVPLMSILGQGIHDLWTPISGDGISFDALNGAGSFLQGIAAAMNEIKLATTPDEIGQYTSAFNGLKSSFIMGEENTVANTIEQIFSQIQDKEVQVKITPVFDDTNMQSNWQLPEGVQLDNSYSRNITLQLNMNDVQNVRVEAAQIQSLVTANNETRDKIGSLATAISQIKIQVNLPTTSAAGPRQRFIEVYPAMAAWSVDNP